ncbi:histidine decarboxylase [compost metagenome]
MGIDAWRNTNAITVNFPAPSGIICKKWQLAAEQGNSHIICMPNVTKAHIDLFITDLKAEIILQN